MNKIENSQKVLNLMYYKMFKTVFEKNINILAKIIQVILNENDKTINLKRAKIIPKENSSYLLQFTTQNKETELVVYVDYIVYPDTSKLSYTYSFDIQSEKQDYQISLNNFPNLNKEIINEFYLMKKNSKTNVLSKEYPMIQVDVKKCYENFKSKKDISLLSSLERLVACLYTNSLAEMSLLLGNDFFPSIEKEKFINDIITSSEEEIMILQKQIEK